LNGKELLPDQTSLVPCSVKKDVHAWTVSAAASLVSGGEEGHQEGKKLFADIRGRGYIGSYATLMRFLASWREEQIATGKASRSRTPIHSGAMRHITPHAAVALMSKPKPGLSGKQREMVEILKRRCPGFGTMRHVMLSFRGIVCGGKASSLRRWAENAQATGIGAIQGFVGQLMKDWAAAENAVKRVWSKGPVEVQRSCVFPDAASVLRHLAQPSLMSVSVAAIVRHGSAV